MSDDNDDPIRRNPERVAEIPIRAFARAKRAAIEENDRLASRATRQTCVWHR